MEISCTNSIICTISEKEGSVTEFLRLILNGFACSDCTNAKFLVYLHITFINIRAIYDTFKSRLYSYRHTHTQKVEIFIYFLQFLIKPKKNCTINVSQSSYIERRTRELNTKWSKCKTNYMLWKLRFVPVQNW